MGAPGGKEMKTVNDFLDLSSCARNCPPCTRCTKEVFEGHAHQRDLIADVVASVVLCKTGRQAVEAVSWLCVKPSNWLVHNGRSARVSR